MGDEEILALPDVERIRQEAIEDGVPVLERHLCEAYRAGHADGFSKGAATATVRWRELSPMPCPLCGERPRVTICSLFDGGWVITTNPCEWRIVKPDSWEKVERDVYRLVMSEYLDDPEGDVKKVMRRIEALAGVE